VRYLRHSTHYVVGLCLQTAKSDDKPRTRSSAIAVIANRTACSILTLFIAIAASRPLNKKIRSLAVRGSNNYCGSASAIRSPHISAATAVAGLSRISGLSLRVTVPCVIVDKRAVHIRLVCLGPLDTNYGVSHFVFVVHFVAKQYILEQKCLKGQIGSCVLGTCWCNFQPRTPTLRATMHSGTTDRQTDRRTDGRTDNRMMPIAYHTV